jgi:hypothetical protein
VNGWHARDALGKSTVGSLGFLIRNRGGAAAPASLIAQEGEQRIDPSGDRRASMIAGFNRGYNGFQQNYRTCTSAASDAIRR